jgi:hypothetical protein
VRHAWTRSVHPTEKGSSGGQKYEPASHAVVLPPAGVPSTVNSDARRIELVTPGITDTTRHIDLHYYHDASVTSASGKLYDDDGETARAYEQGKYEIVRFVGKASAGKLEISLQTETGKAFKPVALGFTLLVHNITARPRTVSIASRSVPFKWNAERRLLEANVPVRQRQAATVAITL